MKFFKSVAVDGIEVTGEHVDSDKSASRDDVCVQNYPLRRNNMISEL